MVLIFGTSILIPRKSAPQVPKLQGEGEVPLIWTMPKLKSLFYLTKTALWMPILISQLCTSSLTFIISEPGPKSSFTCSFPVHLPDLQIEVDFYKSPLIT